jgi:hypothetical protein
MKLGLSEVLGLKTAGMYIGKGTYLYPDSC